MNTSSINTNDYTHIVNRSGVSSLIPTDYAKEIIQTAVEGSYTLPRMTRLNDMPTKIRQLPVMSLYPQAYFLANEAGQGTDDTFADGLKKTAKENWSHCSITAEELAVIVPIPAAVVDDAATGYDIWGEVAPRLAEAISRAIDAAIIHGANKPTSWPVGIVAGASAAAHSISKATSVGAGVAVGSGKEFDDLYDAILGEGGLYALVEQDGYEVDGVIAALSQKAALRGLRSSDGIPLFQTDLTSPTRYALAGVPIAFPKTGLLMLGLL